MTFSIVAIDKKEKEVGFAIASCAWNSGICCHAEAEKGAIASQAQGNLKFFSVFFEQLEENKTLEQIMEHFKEIDEGIENRQIGLITFTGKTLAFTGQKCNYWAGHKTGKDYACQGNILVGPEVIDEMVLAFENTKGSLMDRLLAAMQAGEKVGGDARGKQSARLAIKKIGAGFTNDNTVIDITIEDHDEPVQELSRIIDVYKNLETLNGYYLKLGEAKEEDEKLQILEEASKFIEDKEDARYQSFWLGLGFAYLGLEKMKQAIYCFKKTLEISPRTIATYERLVEEGHFPKEILDVILK
jgi:uncharacterized Ntn-hydrolase superfamily protein